MSKPGTRGLESIEFRVADMRSDECVDAIACAVMAADPDAWVEADLTTYAVRVDSALDVDALSEVIASAGYTPIAGMTHAF